MAITYEDVVRHYRRIKPDIESLLTALETRLKDGRDENDLPIYATKSRLKAVDSIYLKVKRKSKLLSDITDYGGLRILCLCEQDILPIHSHLTEEIIKPDEFTLKEFRGYNWNDKEPAEQLAAIVTSSFPDISDKIRFESAPSGYKSLHYLLLKNGHNIEVQLRTLLQDAWGELSHALAYKRGDVHPHITESFRMLSASLGNDDSVIRHLRDISDKEHCVDEFASEQKVPFSVFLHENLDSLKPFMKDEEMHNDLRAYEEFLLQDNLESSLRSRAEQGMKLYEKIAARLTKADTRKERARYWADMEEAYWVFCSGQYDVALKKYEELVRERNISDKYYVPYLRMGEIWFIKGNTIECLRNFDKCEEILHKHAETEYRNYCKVKVLLASIYWQLGKDYYHISVQKMVEAETAFYKDRKAFSQAEEASLKNNLCWYNLEKYLRDNDESDYTAAVRAFGDLEVFLDRDDTSSNAFDTACWLCFQRYIKNGDVKDLKKAKLYVTRSLGRQNRARTHMITSYNMHRSHIQEIMARYRDVVNREEQGSERW